MKVTATELILRIGISASLAIGGVIHAYLYVDSYRYIPTLGPSFLLQGSLSCAVAVLILSGGPGWLRVIAAALAIGSLVAFGLSRTVGLFGFTETGWAPPYGPLAVAAEAITLALCATWMAGAWRRASQHSTVSRQPNGRP
jgi:hypothetical protein